MTYGEFSETGPASVNGACVFGNAASRMQGIVAGFGWEEATIGSILGVIFAAGGQRRQTLGFAAKVNEKKPMLITRIHNLDGPLSKSPAATSSVRVADLPKRSQSALAFCWPVRHFSHCRGKECAQEVTNE